MDAGPVASWGASVGGGLTGEFRWHAANEESTRDFGRRLADALTPGSTVGLIGPLGAGKTRLVKALAEAAGAEGRQVNSPTFTLIHEYAAQWPIYHFDVYRLGDAGEFLDLGAEEYFAAGGVCLIEWADRVLNVLPADRLEIRIEVRGNDERDFLVTARGPRSAAVLATLAGEG